MDDKPAPKRKRYGGRKPQLDAELVAAALVEYMGNISAVAKRFKVHRSSVQELIGKRPSLQRILADSRESMIDNAESALHSKVIAGEGWAVCFCLKTQGRSRGYDENETVRDLNKKLDSLEKKMEDYARHIGDQPAN